MNRRGVARLAGVSSALIAIVVAIVAGISGCQSARATYADYLVEVRGLAQSSSAVGSELATQILSPTLTSSQLVTSLQSYALQEQQVYDEAQRLQPPGALRQIHPELEAVLELRAQGLVGLAQLFTTAVARNAAPSPSVARALAAQGELLISSDIVWDELYRSHAIQRLRAHGITGLTVPESHFLANDDLLSARSFALLLGRLRGVTANTVQAPVLKPGASGSAVVTWQTQLDGWLRRTGRALVPVTGAFDVATQTATKTLQQAAAIPADGIVGPATRHALARELAIRPGTRLQRRSAFGVPPCEQWAACPGSRS